MRTHILPGYVFGVLYGLSYGFFAFHHDASLSFIERAAITLLGAFTVAGAIGATAGLVVAFCVAARRRWKYARSPLMRD
jgi:hypothetical protein